jgi:hypothetical protein
MVASLLCIASHTSYAQGQFKIRNDQYIQLGYSSYKTLTFGQSTGTPNNGKFALEDCPNCATTGFNLWKPWPTALYANYLLFIRDNGNVGIGNAGDASIKLNISGSARATAWLVTSDERLKENFSPLNNALNAVNSIPIYQYKYKAIKPTPSDSNSVNNLKLNTPYSFDDKQHIGVKAQELKNIYPELVITDENGYMSVNYIEMIPVLLRAIQEQNEKIAKLENLILQTAKK